MALERRLKLAAKSGMALRMETRIKVAFATGNMKQVDQHFGAAEALAVYALNSEQATLAEVAQFGPSVTDGYEGEPGSRVSAGAGQSGPSFDASGRNENKLAAKIDALDGCVAVYCLAVGASAINQLRAKGIQAIKVSAGSDIRDLLAGLQEDLKAGPSTWLGRAMAQREPRDSGRFDHMEQEGWVE